MDISVSHGRRAVARRMCLALFVLLIPKHGLAQPKLGDDEWTRHFRDFVKAFNGFVEALNDGRLDLTQWERMRTQWTRLDVP